MCDARLLDRLNELRRLSAETEWVEFKENNFDANMIGKTVSALANAAALRNRPLAWLVWGVADGSHDVVGTSFDPYRALVGNQPLELWLSQRFRPDCPCHFQSVECDGKRVVLLEIPAAVRAPTTFENVAYIRIGSATPKLTDYPERQRQLWQKLTSTSFEQDIALSAVKSEQVLSLIDIQSCFDLLRQPLPDGRRAILERLEADGLLRRDVGERWDILNLAALLFAKKLSDFPQLSRKAVRVILYRGRSRVEAVREQVGEKGYASGFTGLMGFITGLLPANELIGRALREQRPLYP